MAVDSLFAAAVKIMGAKLPIREIEPERDGAFTVWLSKAPTQGHAAMLTAANGTGFVVAGYGHEVAGRGYFVKCIPEKDAQ